MRCSKKDNAASRLVDLIESFLEIGNAEGLVEPK